MKMTKLKNKQVIFMTNPSDYLPLGSYDESYDWLRLRDLQHPTRYPVERGIDLPTRNKLTYTHFTFTKEKNNV